MSQRRGSAQEMDGSARRNHTFQANGRTGPAPSSDMHEPLFAIARDHGGVVSRRELLAAGMSSTAIRRRVRAGWLTTIHEGTYCVSAFLLDRRLRVAAAVETSDEAVADAHDAAFLFGLGPYLAQPPREDPSVAFVALPHTTRLRLDGITVRRQLHRTGDDVSDCFGVRTVSPARLVLDMAGRWSLSRMNRLLDDCLRARIVTIDAVAKRHLELNRRGRRGVKTVDLLLAQRPTGHARSDSNLEERVARILIRAGLPDPVRAHRVTLDAGRERVLDLAYPRHRVGIEVDGFAWHSTRSDWASDQTRANELAALGWRLLRVTDETIANPQIFLTQLRLLL